MNNYLTFGLPFSPSGSGVMVLTLVIWPLAFGLWPLALGPQLAGSPAHRSSPIGIAAWRMAHSSWHLSA